jgi:hypothetical protein
MVARDGIISFYTPAEVSCIVFDVGITGRAISE